MEDRRGQHRKTHTTLTGVRGKQKKEREKTT
jgi:hypothetical protein